MQFRTEINILKSKIDISYRSLVFFIGSCFSKNIGDRLKELKFQTVINPFGVLYNPLSVSDGLESLINNKHFTEEDIFFDNDLWASFSFHSSFSDPDKNQFLEKINRQVTSSGEKLKKTDILFITWGTAWVYQLKETKRIAANCHKIPASKFNRFLLETNEILEVYDSLFEKLKEINPSLKVVITVSPIRHWKDGAVGNQISKSTLILAANKLVEKHDYVEYFPSYEIMMDDLRDYRFYEEDMLHPNKQAIDYIWKKFEETYFSIETQNIIKEVASLRNAANHKPFNPNTKSHQKFVESTILKIKSLIERYREIDLSEESKMFENQRQTNS